MIEKFISHENANSYLYINKDKKCFLVDTNEDYLKVFNYLKQNKYELDSILLTHGHLDHIISLDKYLEEFPNLKVYIHKHEKDFLTNPNLNLSTYVISSSLKIDVKNLILVNDDDEIEVGGVVVKVKHTPFHTLGSVCYYVKEENALFSGDTLFHSTIGRTDLPTSDPSKIPSSLKKIIDLPSNTRVLPGHEKETTIEREIKHNPYILNLKKEGNI